MSRFIDVSHPVVEGMETYRPLPTPKVEVLNNYDSSRYDGKSEFLIASLHLCGNTGTYVDSPRHRFRDGTDLAGLPLERLADLQVVIADATAAGRAIGPDSVPNDGLRGKALLVRTDFSSNWGTDRYFTSNPFLTAAACQMLVDAAPAFVGIDSLNIDNIADMSRPAHTLLLGAGIPICEHMTNLASLGARAGRLHAVPIAWVGGATFPVRAYVIVEDYTSHPASPRGRGKNRNTLEESRQRARARRVSDGRIDITWIPWTPAAGGGGGSPSARPVPSHGLPGALSRTDAAHAA